jgi:hypothetical protein
VSLFSQLPIFIPAFEAPAIELLQGLGMVDGVDTGVGKGLRVELEKKVSTLSRDGESSVDGEIVWLNATKYEEALLLADAWFEDNSTRTKCQACDERAGCTVDCWVYVGR